MEMNELNESGVMELGKDNLDFFDRNLPMVVGSDGKMREFDPSRIKISILKETSIKNLPNADDVADEVTGQVCVSLTQLMRNKNKKEVTAPMVREIVCGHLYAIKRLYRDEYTRLGIPYADFREAYGHLFDEVKDWETLTHQDVCDFIIPKMNSTEIIELVFRIAKDYIGVRNNIQDSLSDVTRRSFNDG